MAKDKGKAKHKSKKFNFIKAVGQVTKPIGDIAKKPFDLAEKAIDKGSKLLGDLSLPLLIGGCVLGYVIITNKR